MRFDLFCHIDVIVAIEETVFLLCCMHTRARVKKSIHICIVHLKDG